MPLILDGTNGVNASTGSLNLQTGGTSAITIDSSQVATFSNAPTSGIQSTYSVRGLTGLNNSTTPNTQYDFSADAVVLINTNGAPIRRVNTGTITNNVSAAGAVANGRDQSGAFSSSSWIHFYFIWNGTTLATVSSATAPPTGPTLPTGYTHWAYLGAVRFNGSSQMTKTWIRGSKAIIGAVAAAGPLDLNYPNWSSAISVSTIVPPNALTYTLGLQPYTNNSAGSGASDVGMSISVDGGTTNIGGGGWWMLGASGYEGVANFYLEVPNASQQFYYLIRSQTIGAAASYITCNRYTMPNGGE